MKSVYVLTLICFFSTAVFSQVYSTASKVEILEGHTWYPGKIIDIKGDKFKIHYDMYTNDLWDTWITKERLRSVTVTNQKNITAKTDVSGTPKFYSGSTTGGSVYYLMYPSGQIVMGCPAGGLENFSYSSFCSGNNSNCGVYSKGGNVFAVTWNNGASFKGKIMANGDIDFNGSLIAPVSKVPAKISGNYEFTMNLGGMSIAEVTKFKEDGTYSVIRNSGYDHSDGKNSAEWESAKNGMYRINGYTITMTDNGGKVSKHTIYSLDNSKSPDYLGWDGNFLARGN